LNAKAIFDPSLKKGQSIFIDDDTPKGIPTDTGKEAMATKTIKNIPMKKTRRTSSQRRRVTFAI